MAVMGKHMIAQQREKEEKESRSFLSDNYYQTNVMKDSLHVDNIPSQTSEAR